MSADIIQLANFRAKSDYQGECDIVTAVDVAIRDLREILQYWGSENARARAQECERMLTRVFETGVVSPSASS